MGLKKVPAKIENISDRVLRIVALIENGDRRELTVNQTAGVARQSMLMLAIQQKRETTDGTYSIQQKQTQRAPREEVCSRYVQGSQHHTLSISENRIIPCDYMVRTTNDY